MNWLAHVFLSEPDIDHQLGNLLADLVRGDERAGMSPRFVEGALAHKAIDAFTDAHPIVRRSRSRVGGEYRRFSGVLIDVYYDYLLANDWARYSSTPLPHFTSRFYTDTAARQMPLPPDARETLERIVRHDLLGSYARLDGVERALRRISAYLSSRWRRPFALERAVGLLQEQQESLAADFYEFFPELQAAVARHAAERRSPV